ncbi:hypothetical protein MmiEs2_07190 [Methanimicrococcus stummii]|uniref:Uncharacterized protein n=1 Tax=Methanimicrococcus stummii TaxID=3028294 RepID=A0AA96V937_9EURY|nr:hypothetical protein [Methanimicrococcus sp. Es2]WNY28528.1 hypothetical protein MmiEs2_07190 [Methanimicrococcus sp. Es2]
MNKTAVFISLFLIGILLSASVFIFAGNDFLNSNPENAFSNNQKDLLSLRNVTPENIDDKVYANEIIVNVSPEYIEYSKLAANSDLVIKGKVVEILPAWWTIEPEKQAESDEIPRIYHDVAIEVEEIYKGNLKDKNNLIYVRTLGGVVGDTIMITNLPEYYKGEEIMLYLVEDENSETKNVGPEHYFVLNKFGQFFIIQENTAVNAFGEFVNIQKELLPYL